MPDSVTRLDECNSAPADKAGIAPRLVALDLIRGVAVLGILPVHISWFADPGFNMQQAAEGAWPSLFTILAMLCFEGKMVTLLSILFGVGMAIQARHAHAAGRPFGPYYRRRMVVLFLFGVAHVLLLFHFDILTSYAVAGLIALLFIRMSDRALLRVATICFAWSFGLVILFLVAAALLSPESFSPGNEDTDPPAAAQPASDSAVEPSASPAVAFVEDFFSEEKEMRLFRDGSFRDMVLYRAIYLVFLAIVFWVETGWYLLGCMLIGVWLVRRELFEHQHACRHLLRRFIVVGLPVGAVFHTAAVIAYLHNPAGFLSTSLIMFGALPLALFYLSLLILWAGSGRVPWLQDHLGAAGRMSLTNYLLQSVLCGFIFYGYGLGLYGQLGRAACFGVVLGIWIFLALLSRWWLRRFPLGPAEWAWRRLAGTWSHSDSAVSPRT